MGMKIHNINTAVMTVKNSYYDAPGRNRLVRLGSVPFDRKWRDLPVNVWAIEHPEGVIVIDAGESAGTNDPKFFPLLLRPFFATQYRFHVRPQDEIGPQLRARGIMPQDVRWVVMTHAHFDHSDALYHFPNAEVIFSRKEYEQVMRSRALHFSFPSKWPRSIKPRLIDYVPEPLGPFSESYPLTIAGDVWLVPTPGHTMGHQSVILRDNGMSYFFAGDASFDLPSLLNGTLDAPAENADKVFETRQRIIDYAADKPTVYLTTHDANTEDRLNRQITLMPRRVPQEMPL
jgi:N-acyl homoserine lactone hydrolase